MSDTSWATNWERPAAWEYHERTKHSFESVRRSAHLLDWENRPHPFKQYLGLEARLTAQLKPATYELYCSVTGHKQLGMDVKVPVR